MQVNIVDALMGMGKTSAMINRINASDKDTRFLYITPYLTEVERIIRQCPFKAFKQPEKYGTKKRGIRELLDKGVNIVSTHSLFREFDDEIIDLAFNNNYILVMDEVADVIDTLAISKEDFRTIREKYTEVVDGHLLKWTANDYEGKFNEYKRLCDLECIGIYNDKVILWLFPISTFRGFKEIYILTYIFEAQAQKYYFDFYGVEYKELYVVSNSSSGCNSYQLTEEPQQYDYFMYAGLISILENEKLNKIGELEGALSKSWYERNKNNQLMNTLKKNLINYFQHYSKTNTKQNMWTTFKDYHELLKGKGYARGFVASNIRATNDYKDKTAVAYPINKFFNPFIKNFFIMNGIEINEDAYALSEMVQWIFRSAIRQGLPIQAYIPSKRMRNILQQWLEEIKTGSTATGGEND